MTEESRGETRAASDSSGFFALLAAWTAVILYLRVRPGDAFASAAAVLPVSSIASWGWLGIVPGVLLFGSLRASGRTEVVVIPEISGVAIAAALGGWIASQGVFAIPLVGRGESLAAPFAAMFTAAWILNRIVSPGEDPLALLRELLPTNPTLWLRDATFALGACCALLAVLSIAVLGAGALRPGLMAGLELNSSDFSFRNDLVEILIAVAAMPLLEEFVFRAGLIGWLRRRRLPIPAAVAVSALFFALAHLQPGLVWARGLGGLFMGWLYVRTGRLAAPFLLHAATNCGILFAARAAQAAGWI
jgi:membrane protease YdiL (CAAX protease family)